MSDQPSDNRIEFHLSPASRMTIEALAEQAGVTYGEYLEQSIGIGLFCAEICLRNFERGEDTKLALREPTHAVDLSDLDFVPDDDAETDDKDPNNVQLPDKIKNLFDDEPVGTVVLDESASQQVGDAIQRLETNRITFLQVSVTLRFQFQRMIDCGGEMAISDGDQFVVFEPLTQITK